MSPSTSSAVMAAAAGYALGSIPSASIAARLATGGETDLARAGTSNPGGMNAGNVLGRRWGAVVTLADVAKGAMAAFIGRCLAGERGANAAATAAVVGHCYPSGRKGGKGVATSIGQVGGTFPAYLPVDAAVGVSTAAVPWFKRRTETATTVASVAWIGCSFACWRRGWPTGTGRPAGAALPLGALASSIVIHARFRAGSDRVDAYNASRAEQVSRP